MNIIFQRTKNFVIDHFFEIALFVLCYVFIFLSIRIIITYYSEFAYGKFDLGNMIQMIWNTGHGRFMYLTDYFGTNMPRWGMSHVDPILVLFVPLFFLIPHPLTLVLSKVFLLAAIAFLLFALANLKLNSKFAAFLVALSYLLYPALGFLAVRTPFHGVSVATFFFVAAFYLFERMYENDNFSIKGLVFFWILLIITMSGKEQIPLYIFFYGLFIWLYRKKLKLGLSISAVSLVWFVMAFFVIIPAFAHYRIEGYERFAQSLNISLDTGENVTASNYFLSRYSAFGDTYSEMLLNMATRPRLVFNEFFSGGGRKDFTLTFAPVMFLPFLHPGTFAMAVPDLMINYLASTEGIGSMSRIDTHRIAMIIPVIFISTILSIRFLSNFLSSKQKKVSFSTIATGFCVLLLASNFYTSIRYENIPIHWAFQSFRRRILSFVSASNHEEDNIDFSEIQVGGKAKISPPMGRDIDCGWKIVNSIPDEVSVSGPDHLGSPLSLRETYAIFPALYKEADYVIVDAFSSKLRAILDGADDINQTAVSYLISSENYHSVGACGNLSIYRRASLDADGELTEVKIQENITEFESYNEIYSFPIYGELYLVDFYLPDEFTRGESKEFSYTYAKKDSEHLGGFFFFTSFVDLNTQEIYQAAHLPSRNVVPMDSWSNNKYYVEILALTAPPFLDAGEYGIFVGITNHIRTRNVFLGTVEVL